MAQKIEGKPAVDIHTVRDVTIDSNGVSVMAGAINDSAGTAEIKIDAEGKVTLKSATQSAIQGFDKSGIYEGNGDVEISIKGRQGIDLISPDDAIAVYLCREHKGDTKLDITSDEGDVNITGGNGLQFKKGSDERKKIEGTIKGQNINIHSASTAVVLHDGGLDLSVNQNGGKITLNSDNNNAVSMDNGTKLTFGDGTMKTDIYVNGYMTVTDGATATFAENTTTHVDSKYLTNEKKAFIMTGGAGSVNMADTASIMVDGLKTNEKITVNLSDDETLENELRKQVRTDNLLQDVAFEGNTMTVGTVDKATAAERLGGSALTNVALAATEKNMDSVTALITNNASDTDAVKAALNSAAGFSGLANVAHGTYTMNGLFSDAVSGHLMNRQDQDVWAYGFHSKENVNGLSFGGDYDAQYNGVTAGVDLYKNGGTTAGVALTYGDSNVSGSNGFATTKSDSDYYGASIYGRFDRGSYALLGDISYMKGDHDVTQVNSGETITASPDSDSISVGVKALKDYAAGDNGVLTPYVGLRYLRLSTDDFTASNGLHYVGDDQDMVIVPVGVNYTASISHGKWSVHPYAGIGYVWTAGDRSADQTVVVPGGADSFSYDTADSSSFIARVGVTTDCDDMSYGIGYSWQKGDSVSNNAWTLSASFRF